MGRIITRPRTPVAAQLLRPERKPSGKFVPDKAKFAGKGLEGYWVDQGLGGRVFEDISDYRIHGAGVEAVYSAYSYPFGRVIASTARHASVFLPAWNPRFDSDGDFTASIWINAQFLPHEDWDWIWGQSQSGSWVGGWGIYYHGGRIYFFVGGYHGSANEGFAWIDYSRVENQWRHIVAVRSGDTIQIYIDGVAGNSGTQNHEPGNAEMRWASWTAQFDIRMFFDNCFFCRSAFSEPEIKNLYQNPFYYVKAANDRSFVYPVAAPVEVEQHPLFFGTNF